MESRAFDLLRQNLFLSYLTFFCINELPNNSEELPSENIFTDSPERKDIFNVC